MHKYLNRPTSPSPSHPGTWLLGSLTLGLIAAGVAVWLRSLEAEDEAGVPHTWRFRLMRAKDALNKAAQKMGAAHPSAKEEILDLENELHPGG